MSQISNHHPEVIDAANGRGTVDCLIAEIGKVRGYFVTWKSTHFRNGRYCSETFASRLQAEHYALWLRARTGELAAMDVIVNAAS